MVAMVDKAVPTQVFIVDAHAVVREGLHRLTERESDMEVCGEAGTVPDAYEGIASARPDVVVVDLGTGRKSGLDFIRELKTRWPSLHVLVLTVHDEAIYAERSLRAGATGYVMKSEPGSRVVDGIRAVDQGNLYLSDAQSTRLLRKLATGDSNGEGLATDVLTDRELEILEFVGRGLRTRDIASNLHLSVKTVEWHRAQIKKKLRLRDGNELLRYAFHWAARQGMP